MIRNGRFAEPLALGMNGGMQKDKMKKDDMKK